ncbi:ParB/RepB/Spo0J family partition protein [Corynebacterium endometrii]|uniref:Putative chromosome-partitioning protein ParB n=1 Tax=Corynebacterium endometrii TaxID=2488819 RepID=A0A4P7QI31_9CORY|nr:ParB/RepB/Spo0J family partition protein [Corynebacterium endometrii]QCB29491.1 putative chromosome-partitioning protein ParB [Corynebacterium endometrii]
MEDKKQGGLGKGLAALIPSGPGAPSRKPRLGDSAADVILGGAPQKKPAGEGSESPGASGGKRVKGAPTIATTGSKKRQPKPAAIGATYREIPIGDIIPNPKQPRTVFDEEDLNELVHSIREFGLLQPVVVRPGEDGFELIMGERRWRASSKAGLATIPAIVRDTSDDDLLRDALLENIHRVQLNPLEEAAAYQQLLEEFGVTQNELADRIGRSRPQVTNMLRLLKLPVSVQKRVAAGVLSSGHARALLGLDDPAAMEQLADRIVAEGLSVRATEEAVTLWKREGKPEEKKKRPVAQQPQFFTDTAERLADRFDTKVTVTMGKRKGKMVVEFGDQEDFERILSLIEGKK